MIIYLFIYLFRVISKKKMVGGWVGGVSSIQFFLDVWNLFNFARPLMTELSHNILLMRLFQQSSEKNKKL